VCIMTGDGINFASKNTTALLVAQKPPRPPTSMFAGGRWAQTLQRGRLTGINFASWPSSFAPPTLKWGSGGDDLCMFMLMVVSELAS
jgi:hypothetical protein